jgi:HlyD family secretion protein
MKRAILVILILGTGIAAYGYYGFRTVEFVPDVTTVAITEGYIVDTVGATGALEAVTTVQVGSQVSGIIQELLVDFNSIVREGDVIMRLDPSLFETQLAQARANLARSEAEVERLRVSVEDAETQLRRAEGLAARALISETELDAANIAVRSAEAQIKSAEAQVTQSQASLNQNEVNLEHTVIRAPIDGIVTSRMVDVGQTVAASFQAPELFVIAADLTKMRVIANIDESDVGRIRPNQRVTFTVDAFPTEEFEGSVSQIRLEPIVTQNVVTYATVIDAPNPELKLKPGMTATVTVEVARRENVTRIPNSALRFRPTPAMFAALGQPVPPELQVGRRAGAGGASGSGGGGTARSGEPPADAERPGGTPGGPPGGGFGPPGGGGPGGFGGGGGPDPERRQRMMERTQQMSPEERQEFFARMRERRAAGGSGGPGGPGGPRRRANAQEGPNVPAVERGASTIDALFAPIEVEETTGRVWVLNGGRLSSRNVRLGVTDGTASELTGVVGGPDASGPPPQGNPEVESLRERLATVADAAARGALEQRLAALEASTPVAAAASAPAAPGTIDAGLQLVTNVTTPASGGGPSVGNSGSPLIPQFPFGRRRR